MLKFRKLNNAFNYVFEGNISADSEEIIKIPDLSVHKHSVNSIGYAVEDGISLYVTVSSNAEDANALWQQIKTSDDIHNAVTFIKIINTADVPKCVNIRVIMN